MDKYLVVAFDDDGLLGYVVTEERGGYTAYTYTTEQPQATRFSFAEAEKVHAYLTEIAPYSYIISREIQ